MSIAEVGSSTVNPYELLVFNKPEKVLEAEKNAAEEKNIAKPNDAWRRNILLQGLEKLENNIQLDDSLPLFKSGAAPIQNYAEALKELKALINDENFAKNAGGAQANIKAESVVDIFID